MIMEIRCNYCDVVKVNTEGIIIQKSKFNFKIKFEECAQNYANKKMISESRCVASRDIRKLCFTFYSDPQITIDFNLRISILNRFVRKVLIHRFLKFQKIINKCGYSTYDLS